MFSLKCIVVASLTKESSKFMFDNPLNHESCLPTFENAAESVRVPLQLNYLLQLSHPIQLIAFESPFSPSAE